MSKKTENILAEIEGLNQLQKSVEDLSKTLDNRELADIQFEMSQRLKNLKFWFESLYLYNGKSTSKAKKSSSRENGKLGGRPPKEITESRKRIEVIETSLLPETEHSLKMTDDLDEEKRLEEEKNQLLSEVKILKLKIRKWMEEK